MLDLSFKYRDLINYLENEAPFKAGIALILGSGLGDFAKSVDIKKTISTKELPSYPPSTITGHEGKIHFAEFSGKKLLIFQGRIHFYEGYKIYECLLPVFISNKLGTKKIFITNAAGGINGNFKPGDLMLITSFNSLFIKKELTELIGISSVEGKNSLSDFPSHKFNEIIKKAAKLENIGLKEGIYWYTKGPSYESPSEIRMMKKFGGDAVGMSSAHEAVFASYLGMEISSVSLITNLAAGISTTKLSHREVTDTANLTKDKFEKLVKRIILLNNSID
ncbi:MAG TPA: purine-nucleoside phosphorylase [Ignavibacteriaceae bacterium]|nr:purine-nucleoside phosphorylase [Ignavibacteriaceae bacterium]